MSGKYLYVRGEPYYVTTDGTPSRDGLVRARRAFLRALPRSFPRFVRGMTTALYIQRYQDANPVGRISDLRGAAHVLPYNLDAYRRAAPVPLPDEPDERSLT